MILRVCVVIPTHNDGRSLSEVVRDVVELTPFPILIIDDGAVTPVVNSLYPWSVRLALEKKRIRVIRFEQQQGKGAALQHAILELVREGYTHMLTMDGDGQHLASEIRKLVECGRENPWDLILGHRSSFSGTWAGRLGRRLSNFWVRYQTGLQIQDSQSGFRLYPLFAIQNFRFFTRRLDFDVEVLTRALWAGVRVREVDVDVQLSETADRARRWIQMWESVRLGLLNLAFVLISLIHSHSSPLKLAQAAGLGVAIGCTPFFGFQTYMALAVGFILRLNLVALLAGTLISVPALSPSLALLSILLGAKVTSSETPVPPFAQWLVGGGLLGLVLGLGVFVSVWIMASAVRYRRRRSDGLALRQSLRGVHWIGAKPLAWWLYLFAHQARRGLDEYYRLLKPEMRFWHRQVSIWKHFVKYSQVLSDEFDRKQGVAFNVRTFGEDKLVRGQTVFSASLGNWEIVNSSAALRNLNLHKVNIDETNFAQVELIPFLGRLAPFDVAPFVESARGHRSVVLAFNVKSGNRVYDLYIRGPRKLVFQSGIPESIQIEEWLRGYVETLREFISLYPDQWFNLFPFWSSMVRPEMRTAGSTPNRLREELHTLTSPGPAWESDRIPNAEA